MVQELSRQSARQPLGSLEIPHYPLSQEDRHRGICFSLVVPTYNEAANIMALIERLTEILEHVYPQAYEIIVVDDDSPDGTWAIAETLTHDYPQLQVLRRQQERGLSTAVIRGWQMSRGDFLGVIDGDLQHPPEVLLGLLREAEEGADFAIASRHVAGGGTSDWGLVRRMLSRGAQIVGLLILPQVVGRVSDPMSGCFVVRRSAIAGVVLDPLGYKISLEVLGRGQIGQIAEVGYVFQERQAGESKVTAQQYIDYLQHLVKLRSRGRIGRMRSQFNFPIKRFLQFGCVGLTGVVVDMAILYCLSDPSMLGWGLTRSKIIAGELAIVNNFLWNDFWTFRDLTQQQYQPHQILKRFLKFNTICLMGLIMNVLLINLLFNLLPLHAIPLGRYIANFIAIALVTAWNFWINLKLSWRVTAISSR
jgi:dolichol-phosphate mannosyltransferase